MVAVRTIQAFLFWYLLDCCAAVTCHPPRGGILPLMQHCQELVYKILDASRTSHGIASKTWGRNLDNTPTTVHLPKIYWVAGAGPRTCAVVVDVDKHTPNAVEKFNLGDVGHAAEHIENACLFRKGEVGTVRVGVAKRVEVKLDRVDVNAMPKAGMTLIDVDGEYGRYLMSAELGLVEDLKNQTAVETL